jgi:hypothetical protein
MNDFTFIAIPTWFFWLIMVWASLDMVAFAIRLFNQFLAWRVSKKQAAHGIGKGEA